MLNNMSIKEHFFVCSHMSVQMTTLCDNSVTREAAYTEMYIFHFMKIYLYT